MCYAKLMQDRDALTPFSVMLGLCKPNLPYGTANTEDQGMRSFYLGVPNSLYNIRVGHTVNLPHDLRQNTKETVVALYLDVLIFFTIQHATSRWHCQFQPRGRHSVSGRQSYTCYWRCVINILTCFINKLKNSF